jgi:hypothetical protein
MNAMLQRGDGSGAGAHPDLVRAKETRMRAFIIAAALLVLSPTAPAQDAAPPPARRAQERDDFAAGNEAFQKEDWEGAVKAYQAALAKGSGMRLIHFRLGYSLHMLKRYEEALKHHLLATQLTNRALRIDALYNVACAQALLGRKDEALKFLQYAIDAGFKDTGQVGKDTDLDALRGDERFKKLVEGVGKTPRLDQQLDWFIGTWTSKNENGEVTQTLTLSRPLEANHAIVTTNTNIGGGALTGLLTPNAVERTWTWVQVDGMGTTLKLTGKALEGGGVRLEGRESSIGGEGARVRLTWKPEGDAVVEKAEVSEDGATWRVHHEERYVKKGQG